jgi:hypothetical protein
MELWAKSKEEGILEGWLTKESHDFLAVFRKWELRFFVLNFKTRTLAYYTDNTYTDQRGSYLLGDSSTVCVNYARNPKKPMLEVTGSSRGSKQQKLFLVTPTLQAITLWYVGLRYAVQGEHAQVRVMTGWTASLSAIINVSHVMQTVKEVCRVIVTFCVHGNKLFCL